MKRKLYLSRYDRKLAGVCGGLAEYFGIDSTLVRLLYVFFTFVGGSGIILYIIAAMIMTEAPNYDYDYNAGPKAADDPNGYYGDNIDEDGFQDYPHGEQHVSYGQSNTFGIILIVLGVFFLLKNVFSWHWFSFRYIWPLILIGIGGSIIYKGKEWQ